MSVDKIWIVRYRRYHSDSWSEQVFHSLEAAVTFQHNYLYDRGSDAQAVILEFTEAESNDQ